jgi:hypothetical protein
MDQSHFDYYRKWFKTLLVKDFHCLQVHEEAKVIHEKNIKIHVNEIIKDNDLYTVI